MRARSFGIRVRYLDRAGLAVCQSFRVLDVEGGLSDAALGFRCGGHTEIEAVPVKRRLPGVIPAHQCLELPVLGGQPVQLAARRGGVLRLVTGTGQDEGIGGS